MALQRLGSAHVGMKTTGASGDKLVYTADPICAPTKSMPVVRAVMDALTLIWAILCHLLLTAWPYTGLAILAICCCFTAQPTEMILSTSLTMLDTLIVGGAMLGSTRLDESVQHVALGSAFSPALKYVTILAFTSLLLPRCPHWQGVIDVLDRAVFRFWRRYMSYKVTYHDAVDPDAQYVFAEFPHGVFPLAGQMHAAVWTRLHSRRLTLLAASVLFRIPVWRHYMSVGGAAPATADMFRATLRRGDCVSVHAGGIAEMFTAERRREVIVVRRRRGFVRMAVEHGVPLVPVFHFGNSQLLDFGPKWLQTVSRRLRVSLGFVYGRFGLPLPRQMPVWTVVGEPVCVGEALARDSPNFADRVEAVHKQFMDATLKLYNDHRARYFDGEQTWAERDLVMT